jgi:hypothetical protein
MNTAVAALQLRCPSVWMPRTCMINSDASYCWIIYIQIIHIWYFILRTNPILKYLSVQFDRCYQSVVVTGPNFDVSISINSFVWSWLLRKENQLIKLLLSYYTQKGKISEAFVVHAMKKFWRNTSIAPFILNIDTRRRGVVNFTPQPLHPRESNRVPTEQ